MIGPGGGQAIVLLHGLSNSRRTYDHLVDWLVSRGLRVFNVDLRGHGESGWADSYRASDFASDVAELIDVSGAGPVVVVGHSLGGVVAATLAASHPELVKGLFMEDPPLYQADEQIRKTDPSIREFPAFAEQVRRWQRDGATVDDVVAEYGASPSPYPGETMLDVFGPNRLPIRVQALLGCDPAAIDAGFTGDLWAGLDPEAPIRCPVTVLAADSSLDGMFLPEHAEWYRRAVPQARVEFVEGCAHSIHIERGAVPRYKRALTDLVDRV